MRVVVPCSCSCGKWSSQLGRKEVAVAWRCSCGRCVVVVEAASWAEKKVESLSSEVTFEVKVGVALVRVALVVGGGTASWAGGCRAWWRCRYF